MRLAEGFDSYPDSRHAEYGSVVRCGANGAADVRRRSGRVASMLLALVAAAACTHRPPFRNLEAALTLRVVDAPDQVEAGRQIEVRFGVRNLSGHALSLCSPGGVSMQLQSERLSYVWPIVIHGFTTDSHCSGPFALEPREEKVFVERGALRRDLAAGTASISGRISLYCDPRQRLRCTEVQLETHKIVQVQAPD
jgi:hypothetical protein